MFDHYNQIETYKSQIVSLTNSSGLTVGMAYYVLKDVLNEIYLVYLQQRDSVEEYQDKEYYEEVEIDRDNVKIKELSLQELEEEAKYEAE